MMMLMMTVHAPYLLLLVDSLCVPWVDVDKFVIDRLLLLDCSDGSSLVLILLFSSATLVVSRIQVLQWNWWISEHLMVTFTYWWLWWTFLLCAVVFGLVAGSMQLIWLCIDLDEIINYQDEISSTDICWLTVLAGILDCKNMTWNYQFRDCINRTFLDVLLLRLL